MAKRVADLLLDVLADRRQAPAQASRSPWWQATFVIAAPLANKKTIREHPRNCLMFVTALNPHVGNEKAAKMSLTAYHEDTTLREAAMKLGFLTGEQFDSWVRHEEMTHPLGGDR